MPLSNLTADAIDNLEPQRQSTGRVIITGLTGADVLELAIQSFPLPKETTNPIEAFHLNERRKFAGNTTFDDLQWVFTDYIDNDVRGVLQAWRTQVYNARNGKIGWARGYKKAGSYEIYGPNGSFTRSYTLVGMWPSSFDGGDMDQTADDAVRITMTVTIDKAFLNAPQSDANYGTE